MSLQLFSNNAISLLHASISSTSTSIVLQAGLGSLFPQPSNPGEFFLITLETVDAPFIREIVRVTGRTGDTLTGCIRAQEGTIARSWGASSTLVDHRLTADTIKDAFDDISNINITLGNVSDEIQYINTFIGKTAGNNLPSYSSNFYITNGSSLEESIGDLDQALDAVAQDISDLNKQIVVLNGFSASDTIHANSAEWDVLLHQVLDPTHVWAGKVTAVHNGIEVEHKIDNTVKIGNTHSVSANVQLVAGDMVLTISSGIIACDIVIKRVSYISI